MAKAIGLGPKLGVCVPSGLTASSMRSDQVPTIASFIDFGWAAGAGAFCSALPAAGGFGGAFWAWPDTGSISANAAAAAVLKMLMRFIVFLPLHCRARNPRRPAH